MQYCFLVIVTLQRWPWLPWPAAILHIIGLLASSLQTTAANIARELIIYDLFICFNRCLAVLLSYHNFQHVRWLNWMAFFVLIIELKALRYVANKVLVYKTQKLIMVAVGRFISASSCPCSQWETSLLAWIVRNFDITAFYIPYMQYPYAVRLQMKHITWIQISFKHRHNGFISPTKLLRFNSTDKLVNNIML